MTTATTTLTEFLLARIAEDEEVASLVHSSVAQYHVGWTAAGMFSPDSGRLGALWNGARVLAECEAKRRIVESTRFSDDPRSVVDFWLDPERRDLNPGLQVESLTIVLKHLAAVHADHPDYRPEWRL